MESTQSFSTQAGHQNSDTTTEQDFQTVNHGPESRAGDDDAWRIVLKAGQEYDKEMIDRWKDELNNLLIFAGLFSAVATAFVIESYPSLQEDPTDVSVKLLTQISMQLASFTVSAGYINSTLPIPSPSSSQDSFVPAGILVHINALWVTSLASSLICAVLAITIQQWLRHLWILRDMPPRDAVRLRQWRFEGLKYSRVEDIVWLLPVLLQLAVILFLIGLLLLLFTLNRQVAVVYSVILAIFLFYFLTFDITTLISPQCAYKSPFIPALLSYIRQLWWGWTVGSLEAIVMLWTYLNLPTVREIPSYLLGPYRILHSVITRLSELKIWQFFNVDFHTFWRAREIVSLAKLREKERKAIDFRAIIWTIPTATGDPSLSRIRDCLQVLDPYEKTYYIVTLLRQAMDDSSRKEFWEESMDAYPFNHKVFSHLNSPNGACTRYCDFIIAALDRDWTKNYYDGKIYDALYISYLLATLHLYGGDQNRVPFTKLLVAINLSQRGAVHSWYRVPTILLYITACKGYAFSARETYKIVYHAERHLIWAWTNKSDSDVVKSLSGAAAIVELAVSSTATALVAISQQIPHECYTGRYNSLHVVLAHFENVLHEHPEAFATVIDVACKEDSPWIVTPQALATICSTLAILSGQRRLPISRSCPSRRVEARLRAFCQGRTEASFAECRTGLRRFRRCCAQWDQTNLRTDDKDDSLLGDACAALVLAETRCMRAMRTLQAVPDKDVDGWLLMEVGAALVAAEQRCTEEGADPCGSTPV